MKKCMRLGAAVGLTATLASSLLAADYVVTEPKTMLPTESGQVWEAVTIDADLTLDGAACCLTNSGNSVVGRNASKPVTVTVKNDAQWVSGYLKELAFCKAGGTLDLSATTAPALSWGTASVPTALGVSTYSGVFGTFGWYTTLVLKGDATDGVDPSYGTDVGGEKVMDILKLGKNAAASLSTIKNENTGLIARVLFNGGRIWRLNMDKGAAWFSAVKGSEVRLEGQNGNDIILHAANGTANLLSGEGTLVTTGACNVVLRNANSCRFDLSSGVKFRHSGDTAFNAKTVVKMLADDILAHGPDCGILVLAKEAYNAYLTQVDLNGTTQTVNGVKDAQGFTGHGQVINTSATRATFKIDESAENPTVQTTFDGPIDVLQKSEVPVDLSSGFQFKLANGAEYQLSCPLLLMNTFPEGQSMSGIRLADVATPTVVSNGYFSAFTPIGLRTVVASDRWCVFDWDVPYAGWDTTKDVNVYSMGTQVPTSKADAGKRDKAPTFMWTLNLSEGRSVEVAKGALVTSNLTAEAGARLVVASNAEFRVESRAARADRFIRFVFKENVAKSYFFLGKLYLVDANNATYQLNGKSGHGYVRNTSAASAAELNPGEFMYHTGAVCAVGKGNVDGVLPADCTLGKNSYYNYGEDSVFNPDTSWSGLCFTESKMERNTSSTWKTITIRLKDDAPALIGYRFSSMGWILTDTLTCWTVEASSDGVNWTTVDDRVDHYNFAFSAISSNGGKTWPYAEGYGAYNYYNRNGNTNYGGIGDVFRWTKNVAAESVSADFGGATVRVDRGGLIDAAQTDGMSAIAALEVAVATGAGTFRNVSFAQTGTINVVADGTLKGKTVLPMTLESCTGAANLANWSVKINGEANSAATVEWADGNLTLRMNRGLRVIVR